MSRPDPRDARRAQLLDVALTLFAERGYHATSIADIIERAGVARGTFYNYFKSKREIFERLLDGLFDAISRVVRPIVTTPAGTIHEQVRENLAALVDALRKNSAVTRVILEQAVGLDEEGNQQLRAFYGRVLARIEKALTAGQALGIVRAGDVQVMATCLLGMLKESLFQQVLGTRTPDAEVLVNELLQCLEAGVLT